MQELKEYLMFRDFIFPMIMLTIAFIILVICFIVKLIEERKKK